MAPKGKQVTGQPNKSGVVPDKNIPGAHNPAKEGKQDHPGVPDRSVTHPKDGTHLPGKK